MSGEKRKLLDPIFLRKLERLRIQARRAFPGTMRGDRRSPRRGASVEFADFRKYEVGDDFRHVDWSIYARLERLMLRQFVEEEDVRIDIMLDESRSMHFGSPVTKFDFSRRAAAALAFLAISSLDRVGVSTFDSAARKRVRALRGRGHLLSVISFLEGLSDNRPEGEPEINEGAAAQAGQTNLSAVLRSYQKLNTRPGIIFIISDFLDPTDFRAELKLLAHRGYDVNLLQVLAPEEMEPEMGGDFLLVDSETGATREITRSKRVVTAYRAALARHTAGLESLCRASGLGYSLLAADTDFEELLLRKLIEGRMAE